MVIVKWHNLDFPFNFASKMLKCVELFILLQFQNNFVKSVIPELNFHRLDRNEIEQKRQENLEMCRLFNEENQKMKYYSESKSRVPQHGRIKRSLSVNPALNTEEKKRVDAIIDRFYDDVELKTTTDIIAPVEGSINDNTSRRFNFAPAELLGPSTPEVEEQEPSRIEEIDDGTDTTVSRFPMGIVPFYIDPKTYDSQLAQIILDAFDYFEKKTCVRLQKLRERPTDSESLKKVIWLYITNPSGIRQCVHSNERHQQNGVQMIVFGYDCMSLGDITHEIMHVLGFSHEHTRSDRDQFVTIMWDNIKPGYKKYFEIYDKNIMENLRYDYASVLHYPSRAFSKNGKITIKTPPGAKIGQREGLSDTDVEKIDGMYSRECLKRNKDYLLKTCPSVVKADRTKVDVTKSDIDAYFKNRLWPYGIVNYKIDKKEFSVEERDNLNTVIRVIEKETCIKFRDVTTAIAEGYIEEHEPTESIQTDNVEAQNTETTTVVPSTQEENNPLPAESSPDTGARSLNNDNTSPDITTASFHILDTLEKNISNLNNDISYEENRLNHASQFSATPLDTEALRTREKIGTKQIRRATRLPQTRRHAANIVVLKSSPMPGCVCPEPGRPNGDKELTINADCFNSVNDLLHLFVHVLGLDHQHNMHDRDSFLHIVWNKLSHDVKKEMRKKYPPAASVGFAYDYQSVMHYPWLQIKNGTTNIMYPIWNDGWEMGHWHGLSSTDIKKLNILYKKECDERKNLAYH